MALTLNQIVNRIRTLSLSHKQVRSFYFGEIPEFDANGDISYPGVFCEQQPGSVNRVDKLKRFNFRLYFLDLVNVSEGTEGNETEVLSDMTSVADDFLSMLMAFDYQEDWIIADSSSITPVTESLGDMVAGVVLDVGISVEFLADRCQVPADDVEFETDFEMARTRILTYTGTGLEGESFTVTGLAGKNVIAVFRAGQYKRPVVTGPSTDDTIKVTGTDLGSRKGILSSTGNAQLMSGDFLSVNEQLDFLIYE